MEKILQLVLEAFFGISVMMCAVPTEDVNKDVSVEPVRFACMVSFKTDENFVVAGQIFRIERHEVEKLAREWDK